MKSNIYSIPSRPHFFLHLCPVTAAGFKPWFSGSVVKCSTNVPAWKPTSKVQSLSGFNRHPLTYKYQKRVEASGSDEYFSLLCGSEALHSTFSSYKSGPKVFKTFYGFCGLLRAFYSKCYKTFYEHNLYPLAYKYQTRVEARRSYNHFSLLHTSEALYGTQSSYESGTKLQNFFQRCK